jgi:dTDP-4-dehydrorhamnose reductase
LRVLVAGAGGMVGRAVVTYCAKNEDDVVGLDHRQLDISDPVATVDAVRQNQPDVVINCAAWTDVDGCELNRERAFEANAAGPENLARAAREIDAQLITISTDYVFEGTKAGFYTQRDQPAPKSIYGLSKLAGEHRAQLANARTVVVRTGFIFGSGGSNFLSMIIERARRGEPMKAISDSYGTPTYAPDLARRLRELAKRDLPGVFHVVNAGDGVSYEEFARAALDLSGQTATKLATVATADLKRPAPRPVNSRLKCLLSEAIGLEPLPFWRESLAEFARLHEQTESATI